MGTGSNLALVGHKKASNEKAKISQWRMNKLNSRISTNNKRTKQILTHTSVQSEIPYENQ
jgi:hypothetical protein